LVLTPRWIKLHDTGEAQLVVLDEDKKWPRVATVPFNRMDHAMDNKTDLEQIITDNTGASGVDWAAVAQRFQQVVQ
jgi:hypothetical protein